MNSMAELTLWGKNSKDSPPTSQSSSWSKFLLPGHMFLRTGKHQIKSVLHVYGSDAFPNFVGAHKWKIF